MKSSLVLFKRLCVVGAIIGAGFALPGSGSAQLVAYDDAGNYQVTANWTNGANGGFGFTPWAITTNGPDSHGTYLNSGNSPTFVIASVTNVLGTNYTCVWGTFANGTNDINETTIYRGFSSPLGTNTFKIQWGSRGAGVTTVTGQGAVHGWCGFTLRNGNATGSSADFQTGVRLYFYFLDGAAPSTLYFWDGNGVQSIPGTSFSDLGRNNITNAVQVEITPAADGDHYIMIVKDVVQNRTLYTVQSVFMGSGSIDSAALFCHETTGDQIYNRMQIAVPHIPPTVVNVQPTNGSIYLDNTAVSVSFEVDSFNSTVSSNLVSVLLNGVPQTSLSFNTTDPTSQLLGTCTPTVAPDTFYTLQIIAQDANGNTTTNVSTFNTFLAGDLYIDAYDYNYGSGSFVNSSTPSNAYANLLGTQSIDYFDTDPSGTNNLYRPNDLPQVLSLNTDATGDPVDHANLRLNGGTAYNIGFTDAGEWQNYTRTLPAATNYSIYARAASAGGGQFEIEGLVSATATVTNQPLIALGRVNVPITGGSKVFTGQLTPLTDLFGNTVVVPLSGTKTLRTTAISNRGYNLEYLLVVAVTNATSTLRPYIATGSPVPNAVGVGLNSQISLAIANRQTTVTPASIQVFLNNTNLTSRLVLSNNAAGTVVNWSPTNNLPANFTNTVVVIFTDSDSVSQTNSWTFISGTTGGALGSGLWLGGGGADMNWSTAANWTGGTPGPGFNAVFASLGATNAPLVNNIVATNVTIQALFYNTNNSGFHTTLIADGITLTVTNGVTGTTPALQVGGGVNSDNVFAKQVTNTITGTGGTLLVLGNPQGSGLANQLNLQVRQQPNASTPADYQTTLDLSGLGRLVATVGKVTVGQGGAGGGQNLVSGRLLLARTNTITLLRNVAGQFVIGDSSGGAGQCASSTLELGITNALFFDSMNVGKQKATNITVRFNPSFTGAGPVAYIRNTNGSASRVSSWNIGDAAAEATVPVLVSATVDFTGGKLDALVGTMIVGRGATTATDTGFAQGTLAFSSGTLDVNNLTVGVQRANNTATEAGTLNLTGAATLLSTNIVLAQAAAGANATLVTGNLNVTNGTVRGNINAGGGISTVNVNGGTLVVARNAGTSVAPLSALNLQNASLHLNADGNAVTAPVNASVLASGTTITIDSVTNVTGTQTIHLISYSGSDPFAGLSLAPLPAGYTGNLVDNSGGSFIDLNISASGATPPSPTIGTIAISGGQIILSGTNNSGAGGTYQVLISTNVALPLTNWTVLNSGSFDANGNFSFTNSAGPDNQRFYILRVP